MQANAKRTSSGTLNIYRSEDKVTKQAKGDLQDMIEQKMEIEYIYTLVKEDLATGERAQRKKSYYSFKPELKVNELYSHLGKGFPGYYRVLSVKEKLVPTYYNRTIREITNG